VLDLTEGSGNLIERLDRNIEAGMKLIRDNSSVLPMWRVSDVDSPRIDQLVESDSMLVSLSSKMYFVFIKTNYMFSLRAHKTEVASLLTLIQLFLPGPVNIYYGQ
jgi:hypothetical protein